MREANELKAALASRDAALAAASAELATAQSRLSTAHDETTELRGSVRRLHRDGETLAAQLQESAVSAGAADEAARAAAARSLASAEGGLSATTKDLQKTRRALEKARADREAERADADAAAQRAARREADLSARLARAEAGGGAEAVELRAELERERVRQAEAEVRREAAVQAASRAQDEAVRAREAASQDAQGMALRLSLAEDAARSAEDAADRARARDLATADAGARALSEAQARCTALAREQAALRERCAALEVASGGGASERRTLRARLADVEADAHAAQARAARLAQEAAAAEARADVEAAGRRTAEEDAAHESVRRARMTRFDDEFGGGEAAAEARSLRRELGQASSRILDLESAAGRGASLSPLSAAAAGATAGVEVSLAAVENVRRVRQLSSYVDVCSSPSRDALSRYSVAAVSTRADPAFQSRVTDAVGTVEGVTSMLASMGGGGGGGTSPRRTTHLLETPPLSPRAVVRTSSWRSQPSQHAAAAGGFESAASTYTSVGEPPSVVSGFGSPAPASAAAATPLRAADRAAMLHKATEGLGTDEEAVYRVLGQVESQADFDAVARAFAERYPTTYGGDLTACLEREMTSLELQRCRDVLRARRVSLPARDPAGVLHAAMKGLGTDEAAIYGVLEAVASQEDWDGVKQRFREAHAGMCGGDVVQALRGELSEREMAHATEILNTKGILLGAAAAPAAAAPTASVAPSAHAATLHRAMKGFGTDEAAIYGVLEAVKSQREWELVGFAFKKAFPSFHGGSLERALEDELSTKEMARAAGILAANGVSFVAAAPPSPAVSAVSAGRSPAQQAEALHQAMSGAGTDEGAVFAVMEKMDSQAAWDAVQQQYRRLHPSAHGGDVVAALDEELGEDEVDRCRALLRTRGIVLGGGSSGGGGGPLSLEDQAIVLHAALAAVPSDAERVYEVLGGIGTRKEWYSVKHEFKSLPQFHGDNLLTEMEARLSDPQLERCSAILKKKGIKLEGARGPLASAAGGGGADAKTMPSPARQLSAKETADVAAALHKAMKGFGTDEDAVYAELGRVQTAGDWRCVKEEFRTQYPEFNGGNLVKALEDELTQREVSRAMEILMQRGVTW